jgi:hypothetical protein
MTNTPRMSQAELTAGVLTAWCQDRSPIQSSGRTSQTTNIVSIPRAIALNTQVGHICTVGGAPAAGVTYDSGTDTMSRWALHPALSCTWLCG